MRDTTGPQNYQNLSDRIYYSFWSWKLIKDCPYSFYLNVIKKTPRPKKASKHNAIQGSIPGNQSEDFFRLPINQRDMNFFIDTFDKYWHAFLQKEHVDFAEYARQALKRKKIALKGKTEEELSQLGYKLKYDETKQHCSNLMRLISQLNLHKMPARTELPFNVTLEPAVRKGQVFTPELAIGGRIDLVVELGNNVEEIWDVKAVKSPKSLDSDQLLMYKMGRQAAGKTVRRTGYLHAKQCKAAGIPFQSGHEDRLKKMMRQSMVYYNHNSWPAQYRSWKCGYCDVRQACETFKRREAHKGQVSKLKPGKVSF